MAKVHKSHKSKQKYSFQKKHISAKTWLIIALVAVIAVLGGKLWYDNYLTGEFEVAAPSNEQLNTIAANWEKMSADQDAFLNYYQALGYSTDGVYQGQVYLMYFGNENYSVEMMLNASQVETTEPAEALGQFAHTSLTDAINGVAPWGKKTTIVSAANANIAVYVASEEKSLTAEDLNIVLAELEARATAPVIEETVEEATEEVTETTETPAE